MIGSWALVTTAVSTSISFSERPGRSRVAARRTTARCAGSENGTSADDKVATNGSVYDIDRTMTT